MAKKFRLIWIVYALMLLATVGGALAVDLTDGIVSYWKFDENSGTLVEDIVSGNNGSITNADMWTTGLINSGVSSSDEKTINLGATSTSADFSVRFWFKTDFDDLGDPLNFLISQWDDGTGTNNKWFLRLYTDTDRLALYMNPDNNIRTVKTSLSDDTWYQVIVTQDGTTTNIYVNENLEYTSSIALLTNNHDLEFGGSQFVDGRDINADFDEIAYYDKVINITMVQALYNAGLNDLQYPFDVVSNFSVSVVDSYSGANVDNVSIIVDGVTYTNTTGNTVTTNILQNDTSTYLVQVSGQDYFDRNYSAVNVSSNLVASLTQSYLDVTVLEIFTNNSITNFYVGSDDNFYDGTLYQRDNNAYASVKQWTSFGESFDFVFIENITNELRSSYASYTASARYKFTYTDTSTAYSNENSVLGASYVAKTYTNPYPYKSVVSVDLELKQSTTSAGRYAQARYHNMSIVDTRYSSSNPFSFSEGTYNLSIVISDLFKTTEENVVLTALNTTDLEVQGYDSELIIYARSKVGNASISNFSGWIYNEDYDYNNTFMTTTGSVLLELKKDLNYTIYIDSENYAITTDNTVTKLINLSNYNYTFYLYQTNSIDIEFRDAQTKTLITENMTIEFIGSLNSYNYSTTTGVLNVTLITPTDYILRYSSNVTYPEHFYWFTVENKSYNLLTLYLLNGSVTANLTVTIIDEKAKTLEGVIVKTLKYDISTNSYLLQEVKETDVAGQARFNVLYNSEFYRFMVEIDGALVRTTNPNYINSETLTIQVISTNIIAGEYFDLFDITSSITFNNLTNNFRVEYNDANNLGSNYCFKVTEYTRVPTVINETCTTSSSGVILLNVDVQNNTIYEAELYLKINPYQSINILTYEHNPFAILEGFTEIGLLLQIILMIVLVFAFIENPWVGAMLIPISLILGKLIGFHNISFIYLVPLVVVGFIISFIIRKKYE